MYVNRHLCLSICTHLSLSLSLYSLRPTPDYLSFVTLPVYLYPSFDHLHACMYTETNLCVLLPVTEGFAASTPNGLVSPCLNSAP